MFGGKRPATGTIVSWAILVGGAVLAGLLARVAGFPAAWLVGPMLAAAVFSLAREQSLGMPQNARAVSQAVIGTVLASAFRPSVIPLVAANWLPVVLIVSATLLLSMAAGFALSRLTSLDRNTAAMGTLPGAASGMLAMSESLSADARIVALMQYSRVMLVVVSATLVSHFGLFPGESTGHSSGGFGAASLSSSSVLIHSTWLVYALTALMAATGAWAGRRLRLPAGALLGPLVLGLVLSEAGFLRPALPSVVPPIAYAILGLYVGLLFDSESLKRAGRLLPAVIFSTVLLMVVCAGSGLVLSTLAGTDPFTAYLATTPGGIDSVAIIALGSGADTSLVLAVQMLRLLAVVIAGPLLVRRLAHSAKHG